LEYNLREAGKKYTVFEKEHSFVKPEDFIDITDVKTEDSHVLLWVSYCIFKGEKEWIITIYIQDDRTPKIQW
jgi:hypothetical protein